MLRRIALAITLITGSLQAEDLTQRQSFGREELDQEHDWSVNADGTVASWGILRLVLPDLEDESGAPEWIETPTRSGPIGTLSLHTLGGRAVTGATGDSIGIVRGCLLNPTSGRVLALDVEVGASLGCEPRRVALPWSSLSVERGAIRYVGDVEWVHSAPSLERK